MLKNTIVENTLRNIIFKKKIINRSIKQNQTESNLLVWFGFMF